MLFLFYFYFMVFKEPLKTKYEYWVNTPKNWVYMGMGIETQKKPGYGCMV